MLRKIKSAIPGPARNWLRGLTGARAFANLSFSQEGEDILLARIFNDAEPGSYIDVGAHHPFRFSNTYIFYRRGWRGINIDAMPGSMLPFRTQRPRDTNLEVGISAEPGTATFNIFSEPALNTFDPEIARQREGAGHAIRQRVQVECLPLSEIVRRHLPEKPGRNSFLSVDVEGLDLQVLQSNDWSLYAPSIIVAEVGGKTIDELLSNEVARFLERQGYALFSKLGHSVFFKRFDFEIK
jgi:FkbM family methyltransferase